MKIADARIPSGAGAKVPANAGARVLSRTPSRGNPFPRRRRGDFPPEIADRHAISQQEAPAVPIVADPPPCPGQPSHQGCAERVGEQDRQIELPTAQVAHASPSIPSHERSRGLKPAARVVHKLIHPVPASQKLTEIRMREKRDPRPGEPLPNGAKRRRSHHEIPHPCGQDHKDGPRFVGKPGRKRHVGGAF